jgi:hypothetical protein
VPKRQSLSFLSTVADPHSVITAIDSGLRFPEVLPPLRKKYEAPILQFADLVMASKSSAELLARIRTPEIRSEHRMALLKVFRRCVSGICDTEATKKIKTISTNSLVENYGSTFKPIAKLKRQFRNLTPELISALAVSVGEYDNRGKQGYVLVGQFFDWFIERFKNEFLIEGRRVPGEHQVVVPGFVEPCFCDFAIRNTKNNAVIALGFARYDSTRGGAQSDDRTSGNTAKIYFLRQRCRRIRQNLRVIFLADGPGLTHRDTWREAVALDGSWNDNVRVTTLKLANERVTSKWLQGVSKRLKSH